MSVAIIAGKLRGKKLQTASGASIRPTPGVVRERLFNWLATESAGARVLDLFAGTGALGLEAWSRGAERVDFVESAAAHRRILEKNLASCGPDAKLRLLGHDALSVLPRLARQYDLVLADPPFAAGWPERLRPLLLGENSPVHAGGWLYLEANAAELWQESELPAGWEWYRSGRCGDSHYVLLHLQEGEA
ncbi:16S rRNA (guanine(966)-N(2))-methyltransferase RsmD [Acidithiobacillus sp. CV18-2]|uniref:16S rRNA (Guanine(966)-N(2))-methyltransferase RsmD n=1 Tax=Igneacidithiobacillus copahuensis TaxID=2724909 RepID=A0AAE2YQX5_9PROT|nr:16S rRNA (guanine(966)-N(2))-methyltransferase RsmD [Igneacidithiobacillus copahuensis]MBU2753774.1 16S rRNA (guanine(966)-N(2))-methyltransferase RsmD [Acidithiobacillus sp. CV18-3]MBU2756528.1 16S rRNA (guanine(966)-N(2))-methyltransferase RsmD [Acidithiobacillus sp. BN09-2]MBU2776463.1 16S rRNA (guanine(966)-N(2))-methyltransferase RsmD [Acidithiobacillus sp. CV18-2]MBU2795199.1 16S rRNA (guanine(966)-N(2))-methyltransferase RsmD [Acidithiobacillus sp. VAN18-2]MBU2799173.1 16S rRNA (guan